MRESEFILGSFSEKDIIRDIFGGSVSVLSVVESKLNVRVVY